jgi:hypothetical protein
MDEQQRRTVPAVFPLGSRVRLGVFVGSRNS